MTIFKSIARQFLYFSAGLIILAAILISATRLLDPVLNKHRVDIEQFATNFIHMPVKIGKMSLSWHFFKPDIRLDNVTLLDSGTKQPILQINQVDIFLSIPQSLWKRQVIPSGIQVSGTSLNIVQSPSGDIVLQGFPMGDYENQPSPTETKVAEALAWLAQQPNITLENVELRYTRADKASLITLSHLSLENKNNNHTILGKGVLHQKLPIEATTTIQWKGNDVDLKKIKARIYLYLSGVSLPQILENQTWQGWQVKSGLASAKIWASWSHGAPHKIQTYLQAYDINLFSTKDNTLHRINRLSGHFGWKQEGNKQMLGGNDILIDLPHRLWPVTSFYSTLDKNAQGQWTLNNLNIGYLNLTDVQTFLFSSSLLPQALEQQLKQMQISGNLQNVSLNVPQDWNNFKEWSGKLNFSHLSFYGCTVGPAQQITVCKDRAITNLTGNISWQNLKGVLELNSNKLQVTENNYFKSPLNIEQLTGRIEIANPTPTDWEFTLNNLQVLNNDLAANIQGTIKQQADLSPQVNLNANFTMQKASHATRYLPLKTFSPELSEWLEQAFLSGELQSGHVVVDGALKDFPFDHHDGKFEITLATNNVDFRFASDWPILQHVNANLKFIGRQLIINLDKGETVGVPFADVQAEIPDLALGNLHIKTNVVTSDFSHTLYYIEHSPLQKTLGGFFKNTELNGALQLNLELNIPIMEADKTKVNGKIDFQQADMTVLPANLNLTDLAGSVQFTENTINADKIQGLLFNKPITLNLATNQENNSSIIQADFKYNLAIADAENWLKLPMKQYLEGSSDIEGVIKFPKDAPIDLTVHSTLAGVAINLPDQYGKSAQTSKNLVANFIIEENKPLKTQVSYGDSLSAALILSKKDDNIALTAANLQFGSGLAAYPNNDGLYLSGNFKDLDWVAIKKYIGEASGTSSLPANLVLRGINVNVNNLVLPGITLSKAKLNITENDKSWKIIINSDQVDGQISVPTNITRQSQITANLNKVNLTLNGSTEKSTIDVKSLPAIAIISNQTVLNTMDIGKVTFKAIPSANGMLIQDFDVTSNQLNLQTAGQWLATTNGEMTYLRGSATSSHITQLITKLGLGAKNFIAKNGVLNFDLNWTGSPFSPQLTTMNGEANIDIGKGHIADIGDQEANMGIGRMLSLFSLQTLPRRLSLDFSDVFQKGYSFDSVRGDFSIKKGDVFTDNLRFDGPVAKISLDGRIGLKNKDFNLKLNVTPYVTGSIPVAAGVLTGLAVVNPVVGLGTLAVNSLMGSEVSKAMSHSFNVTGTWNNPVWKPI